MKNRIFFLLLFVCVFWGCQSISSVVQEPKVSLKSVDVARITFTGVDLVVHVDVENPNGFSIPLPKIDWELFINTASFIKGSLPSDQTIKRRAKVTLDLPLSVTYDGLYRSFKSLAETKEAAYNIAMGISFAIPIIEDKVYHLDFSGVIPLPRFPKLSPGEVKFSKIDFSGVELSCGINVENPNGFPIPFPKLNWDYGVNGVSVIKSSFAGAGEIAAGAAGLALISVSVSYADVFRAVDSLRNAGEAKSNLSLGIKPEDIGFPLPAMDGVTGGLDIPGSIPILQKPEISFQGITKKSLGTTMEFFLNWEINNKNTFEYDIGEFSYNFSVNNNQWARGRMDNPPKVKAGGKTVVPIIATISAASMVRELVDVINRGLEVDYNCTGNMSLSGSFPGMDKLDFPLNFQGKTRIR